MKKRYTEDFKQQIADLYNQSNKSISMLESEYGVSMAEYKKLQKKNKQLEMENEILKNLRHT